ncbi:hypothetical protein LPA44_06545 [Halobacterium sp. KA-4]|uniref:hypothetical protein n=1 Tax=Halobacterium sp. KA-4 TaxID=2896367 RepID=UPI001E337D5F|nr:hypothetical protein [Halobacterium sp. KA-4]MCD2199553.1 hypothetical protein [Halobacterium sp. KA-4]
MHSRTVLSALGAGITTFLVVAIAVIELLPFEFSALVGLPAGLLAGGAVFAAIAVRYDQAGEVLRYAVDAAAGFGLAIVTLQAVSYVNLAGLRSVLSVDVTVAVAAVVGVLAAVASWLMDRRERDV